VTLQRVENVSAWHQRGFFGLFTGRGYVNLEIGRKVVRIVPKVHKTEFFTNLDRSVDYPVCFGVVGERAYWRFGDRWFWDNEDLQASEVHALLLMRDQRRQSSISRAKSTLAVAAEPTPTVRGAIPEDVKQLVWTRDRGRCRLCGANTELQFDHVIPASMGGASTPENLQILCGPCNRRKGASVASPSLPVSAAPPDMPTIAEAGVAGRDNSQPTPPSNSASVDRAGRAAWLPDPGRQHQLRWWDGTQWTAHVADGGTAAEDPLP
jgi:5-methylcytosine-specific restriction endonuclease McrA